MKFSQGLTLRFRTEPAQRLLELLFRIWFAADVDVAHHTEAKAGRDGPVPTRGCGKSRRSKRAEHKRPADKFPARNHHHNSPSPCSSLTL